VNWLTSFLSWLGEFFGNGENWSGPGGIPMRLLEHLEFSALALLLAVLIAVPLGLAIGHTGRGELLVVVSANLARALPTLGLLVMFVLLLGTASIWPVIIPLVLLSVPPILVNTFEGIKGVDPELRDAAHPARLPAVGHPGGGHHHGRRLHRARRPRALRDRWFRDQGLRERRRRFSTDCAVRARGAGPVRARPEGDGLSWGEPATEGSIGSPVLPPA
jgi:hypothetical protein